MLMRLGFNIAPSVEAPPPDYAHSSDDDDREEASGVRWIEEPQRCRQS